MTTRPEPIPVRWMLLVWAATVATVTACGVAAEPRAPAEREAQAATPASSSDSAAISVDVQPLARIPAGTRVPDDLPAAFGKLIYKYRSRVASGDVKSVPAITKSTATKFFTAMIARVDQEASRFALNDVAVGVGTQVDGQDTIVTADSYKKLGADLSMVESRVLKAQEERLEDYLRLAKSDRLIIADVPSIMLRDGKHQEVVFRYVFLMNPSGGDIEAVTWLIAVGDKGAYSLADEPAVHQKLELVQTSQLNVDAKQFFFGFPRPLAFAITEMPPGETIGLPEKIKPFAAERYLKAAQAGQIETALRQALGMK